MVTALSPAPSSLPRIWLEDTRSIGKVFVRAEWPTEHGLACSIGCATVDVRRGRTVVTDLHWIYDEAPDEVDELVRECLCSDCPGELACFADYETTAQMDAAIEGERYAAWQGEMAKQWQTALVAGAVR